jgi:hypothetical protein
VPSFGEATMHIPANERIEFARKVARRSAWKGRDNVKDPRGQALEGHEPALADLDRR